MEVDRVDLRTETEEGKVVGMLDDRRTFLGENAHHRSPFIPLGNRHLD